MNGKQVKVMITIILFRNKFIKYSINLVKRNTIFNFYLRLFLLSLLHYILGMGFLIEWNNSSISVEELHCLRPLLIKIV